MLFSCIWLGFSVLHDSLTVQLGRCIVTSTTRCKSGLCVLVLLSRLERQHGAAQAAAADGKREAELPPTLKLMQQNTRLIVLTLEAGREAI